MRDVAWHHRDGSEIDQTAESWRKVGVIQMFKLAVLEMWNQTRILILTFFFVFIWFNYWRWRRLWKIKAKARNHLLTSIYSFGCEISNYAMYISNVLLRTHRGHGLTCAIEFYNCKNYSWMRFIVWDTTVGREIFLTLSSCYYVHYLNPWSSCWFFKKIDRQVISVNIMLKYSFSRSTN